LKYLLFKQEGLSARELENHLKQSFPAIKKQLDNLEQA
jgi:predicted ArsR family transcriptional regulator